MGIARSSVVLFRVLIVRLGHEAQKDVGADLCDAVVTPSQCASDIGHPDVVHCGARVAQQDRCDVGQDAINRPGAQKCAGKCGAAFEEDVGAIR